MYCSLTVLALIFFMVAIAFQNGFRQRLRLQASGLQHHIRLPASRNNLSQHITMLPGIIVTATWDLPVCCSRESTEGVLELLEVVYTDE